jgi:hypothetical protein
VTVQRIEEEEKKKREKKEERLHAYYEKYQIYPNR